MELLITFSKAVRIRGAVITAPLFAVLLLISHSALAKGVYQTGPDFIAEVFNSTPQAKSLWLTPEVKSASQQIMGRSVQGVRVRYWQQAERTAWILEEIGKELPITIGVVINQSKIEQVKILAFRESRGGEVRYSAFTAQYKGAKITPGYKLDSSIDGITGATLSVRAVNKVTTLALYYHQLLNEKKAQK